MHGVITATTTTTAVIVIIIVGFVGMKNLVGAYSVYVKYVVCSLNVSRRRHICIVEFKIFATSMFMLSPYSTSLDQMVHLLP